MAKTPTVPDQEVLADVDTTPADAGVVDEETGERKSSKDPMPEGYLTPVGVTHLLAKDPSEGGRGVEVRPQQLYGYARNNQTFKEEVVEEHTDGRTILNVPKFLEWWDAKEQRKAERAAKKAAAEEEEGESEEG